MRNKVYIKTMKLESQINLLYHLLIYLKVNLSKKAVEKELEKHPFRFSLLALSDVLSNFDVGNAAYQMEINELDALPLPLVWIIIKPVILANLELKKVKRELSTFKYNDSIFKPVLNG